MELVCAPSCDLTDRKMGFCSLYFVFDVYSPVSLSSPSPLARNVVLLCTVVACHALAMMSRASRCGKPCSMTLPRVALVPYCYTLLYVCLFDFPSESSHGARCYASHCVCSNNICHKCSLRCNSHSQPGLLIYSFVPYRQLEIGALMSMGVWI